MDGEDDQREPSRWARSSMRILVTSIVDIKRVTHNRIHVLAEHLSRRHQVTVLCMNAWWLDKDSARQCGEEYHGDGLFNRLLDKAEVHYLSHRTDPPVLQQFTTLLGLEALLRKVRLSSFDVHLNYCDLIAGHSVTRAAQRAGIPTVLDIADDLPGSFARSPRVPRLLRPFARIGAERMLQANVGLATRVTCVTEAIRDAYRLPDSKYTPIPNGVHDSFFATPSDPSRRTELGLDAAFVLGFVGTQLEWVDLEPAFAALRMLGADGADVKMLVVGGGETLQANMRLATEHGVSDRVVFTNHVPLGKVPSYISCTDACLICRKETMDSQLSLPLKLFEYMACGKPVISVPLAGVKEAVADRVLYAQGPDHLAHVIAELLGNKDLRRTMGLRGSEFVRERYAWSNVCRRFEDILIKTVDEVSAA